jgi:hypothetical protein
LSKAISASSVKVVRLGGKAGSRGYGSSAI